MRLLDEIKKKALECGVYEMGLLDITKLEYVDALRKICEGNACGGYGRTWACPPAFGTLAECKERCDQYDTMLLFSGKHMLEDSFDYEGMMEGGAKFKTLLEELNYAVKPLIPSDYLMLGNGGCKKCTKCTYPDAPCRHPETLFQPVEGYGFNVSDLARKAGIKYNNGPCSITYFGAILFKDAD